MEKAAFTLKPLKTYKINEKGRPPLNKREELLDRVSKITKQPITRWCRYSEDCLERALIDFGESQNVRSPGALLTFLITKHAK